MNLAFKLVAYVVTAVLTGFAQNSTPDLGWQAISPMQAARVDHCAVSLGDGWVFVAGGLGPRDS